jgi:hypothetical protein
MAPEDLKMQIIPCSFTVASRGVIAGAIREPALARSWEEGLALNGAVSAVTWETRALQCHTDITGSWAFRPKLFRHKLNQFRESERTCVARIATDIFSPIHRALVHHHLFRKTKGKFEFFQRSGPDSQEIISDRILFWRSP